VTIVIGGPFKELYHRLMKKRLAVKNLQHILEPCNGLFGETEQIADHLPPAEGHTEPCTNPCLQQQRFGDTIAKSFGQRSGNSHTSDQSRQK
jgi:hypothetical protein